MGPTPMVAMPAQFASTKGGSTNIKRLEKRARSVGELGKALPSSPGSSPVMGPAWIVEMSCSLSRNNAQKIQKQA